MPGEDSSAGVTVPHDDLDDLYDYSVDTEDVLREFQPTMDAPLPNLPSTKPKASDLGIDEEIQVAKKRTPIAKLDVHRLLSPAGIPKLRRITKERLKFKGKGHEYTDVARLLNLYQLWLDDLYPRAKFADGLAIIEKLGHSKRMQTMRREWINEGKPRDIYDEKPAEEAHSSTDVVVTGGAEDSATSGSAGVRENSRTDQTAQHRDDDASRASKRPKDSLFVSDDEDEGVQPPDDDLDALLAEGMPDERPADRGTAAGTWPTAQDDFEDEMEAIAGMGNMW